MDIEHFLEDLKWKRYGGRFSKDDEVTLLNIIEQNPCHLEAQLLLIECAHYNHPHFFPHFWTVYYETAIELGGECWKPEELAEVYLLGRQLHYYDQNNPIAEKNAAAKAFELAPNNSKAIMLYIKVFRKSLVTEEFLRLVHQITIANPEDPLGYYMQARYLKEYALESGETQYLAVSEAAYQKSLDLGIDRPPTIPRKVVEDEVKKLRDMLDRDGSEKR